MRFMLTVVAFVGVLLLGCVRNNRAEENCAATALAWQADALTLKGRILYAKDLRSDPVIVEWGSSLIRAAEPIYENYRARIGMNTFGLSLNHPDFQLQWQEMAAPWYPEGIPPCLPRPHERDKVWDELAEDRTWAVLASAMLDKEARDQIGDERGRQLFGEAWEGLKEVGDQGRTPRIWLPRHFARWALNDRTPRAPFSEVFARYNLSPKDASVGQLYVKILAESWAEYIDGEDGLRRSVFRVLRQQTADAIKSQLMPGGSSVVAVVFQVPAAVTYHIKPQDLQLIVRQSELGEFSVQYSGELDIIEGLAIDFDATVAGQSTISLNKELRKLSSIRVYLERHQILRNRLRPLVSDIEALRSRHAELGLQTRRDTTPTLQQLAKMLDT